MKSNEHKYAWTVNTHIIFWQLIKRLTVMWFVIQIVAPMWIIVFTCKMDVGCLECELLSSFTIYNLALQTDIRQQQKMMIIVCDIQGCY